MRHSAPALLLAAFALLACGEDGAGGPLGPICETDADCDDGVFCNGEEACVPTSPLASAVGCVRALGPCEGRGCDEEARECTGGCETDVDGDGVRDARCGGTDCDDMHPGRFPGNAEVCDEDGLDEDCDPLTFGFRDVDGDGWADLRCCNGEECGRDCDDRNPGANPTAPEVCNGADDDCDGMIDEGVQIVFREDVDGDGVGSADPDAEERLGCTPPEGFAPGADDCDDMARGVNPAARDRCDEAMVDDDCDGIPNNPPEGCDCTDGQTRDCMLAGRCSAGTQTCVDGRWNDASCSIMPLPEVCNDEDDDCDGVVDETYDGEASMRFPCYADADRDAVPAPGDPVDSACRTCPDRTVDLAPTATDYDCDDGDPGLGVPPSGYEDGDGDGFGAGVRRGCPGDPGFSLAGGDCDDANPDAFPGQTEYFVEPTHHRCREGLDYCMNDEGVLGCGDFRLLGGVPQCLIYEPQRPFWEYDCDPANTEPPDRNGCGGCGPGGCLDGYDSGNGACGEDVTWWDCQSLCGSAMVAYCFEVTSETRPLPCR